MPDSGMPFHAGSLTLLLFVLGLMLRGSLLGPNSARKLPSLPEGGLMVRPCLSDGWTLPENVMWRACGANEPPSLLCKTPMNCSSS